MDSSLLHVWDFFSVEDHKYKGTEINPKQQAPPGADDQRHAIERKTGDFWTLRTKNHKIQKFRASLFELLSQKDTGNFQKSLKLLAYVQSLRPLLWINKYKTWK